MIPIVNGFGSVDAVQLLARILLGLFFILARFRFFYDPTPPDGGRHWLNPWRHEHLTAKMVLCGFTKWSYACAWFVSLVEVFGGLGVLFGLLTPLSAAGLLIVTTIGTRCTYRQKILKQAPCDRIQWCEDYLWLVEPLYIGLSIVVILGGAGCYSLDHVLWT